MIVDVTEQIITFDGKVISQLVDDVNEKNEPIKKRVPITVKSAITESLYAVIPNENLNAEKKLNLAGLSLKFYENDKVDLSEEDVKVIVDRVGKTWDSVIVIYQLKEILYGRPQKVAKQEKN